MVVNNTLEMLRIKNNSKRIEKIVKQYCNIKDRVDIEMDIVNNLYYLIVRWNNLKQIGKPNLYGKTFYIYQREDNGDFFTSVDERFFKGENAKQLSLNFNKEIINEINNILKENNKDNERNI